MKVKYIKKPEIFFVSNQSLEEIAEKFEISLLQLKTFNKVEKVQKGSIIALPIESEIGKRYYVVKPADTLEKISKKLGRDKQTLINLNRISKVFIGQIIFY